jgi:hypothetical protein
MGCMQAGVPFGIMLGYVLGGVMLETGLDWRVAILFQIGLLVPLTFGVMYFPSENYLMHDIEMDAADEDDANNSAHLNVDFVRLEDDGQGDSTVRGRRNSDWSISDSPKLRHLTVMQSIRRLVTCKIYLYMSLGLAALYFVVTGVQFWVTTYFTQALEIPRTTVLIAFTATSVTAPVIGVVGAGFVMDKLGGYKGTTGMARASKCCFYFALIGCVFATPAILIQGGSDDGAGIPRNGAFGIVIVCLWMLLLWGGAVVPIAAGLVLSAVPEGLQAFSFSLSICTYQILGYGAGTFFPGLFIQLLENNGANETTSLRWGFRLILFWGWWAVLFFGLAMRVAVQNAKLKAYFGAEKEKEKDGQNDCGSMCSLQTSSSQSINAKISKHQRNQSRQDPAPEVLLNCEESALSTEDL